MKEKTINFVHYTKTSKSNLQHTLMTDGGKKKAPATTVGAYF